MPTFILPIIAAYVILRILDAVFSRRQGKIKPVDYVTEIGGQYYLVREVPTEAPPAHQHGKATLGW